MKKVLLKITALVSFLSVATGLLADTTPDPGTAGVAEGKKDDSSSEKDDETAIARLKAALAANPDDATKQRIYHSLGILHIAQNKFEAAIADFSQAIVLDPKSTADWFYRGRARRIIGDLDNAITDLTTTIDLDVKRNSPDSDHYYERGQAYLDKNHPDKAVDDFTESIRLNPKEPMSFFNRAVAYIARDEKDKALADFTETLRLDPTNLKAFCYRAALHIDQGNLDDAIADCNRAIALDPKFAGAYDARALAYETKGDRDKAMSDYDTTVSLDPGNPVAHSNRGDAFVRRKEYGKAAQEYSEMLRLDPRSVEAYLKRGEAYQSMGEYDKALADFQKLAGLNPAHGYNNLAWLYATCPVDSVRNGAKAVEYARKACELSEWKIAPIIDTLAAACAEAGDFENAVKYESRFLDMQPDGADEAKARLALYRLRLAYHLPKPQPGLH